MRLSSQSGPVGFLTVVVVAVGIVASFAINADPSPALSVLDGRVLIAQGDNFGQGAPIAMQVSLRTASDVVPLRVPSSLRAHVRALAGQRVSARGTRARGGFAVVSL